ncbi:MAG TPA: hypothetical protein VKJ45_27100 [Blastocatellia bacterium]|nr:hypothetical protein [Blastocatellia bacterium]
MALTRHQYHSVHAEEFIDLSSVYISNIPSGPQPEKEYGKHAVAIFTKKIIRAIVEIGNRSF